MTVVGISKSVSSDASWVPSSALLREVRREDRSDLSQPVRRSCAAVRRRIPRVLAGRSTRIAGHPVNVEGAADLFGVRKAENVTDVRGATGCCCSRSSALLGGGVLVGQALVRTVSASAADLPTWRAIGADRRLAVVALVLPSVLTAIVAVVSTVAVAISCRALPARRRTRVGHRPRHPRRLVRARHGCRGGGGGRRARSRPPPRGGGRPGPQSRGRRRRGLDRLAAPMSARPALMIGARLAGEPGRGRRAVPVRSALIGAIAGVMGVVGCLTFRAGLQDAVSEPRAVRRGVELRARRPRAPCPVPSSAPRPRGRRRGRRTPRARGSARCRSTGTRFRSSAPATCRVVSRSSCSRVIRRVGPARSRSHPRR